MESDTLFVSFVDNIITANSYDSVFLLCIDDVGQMMPFLSSDEQHQYAEWTYTAGWKKNCWAIWHEWHQPAKDLKGCSLEDCGRTQHNGLIKEKPKIVVVVTCHSDMQVKLLYCSKRQQTSSGVTQFSSTGGANSNSFEYYYYAYYYFWLCLTSLFSQHYSRLGKDVDPRMTGSRSPKIWSWGGSNVSIKFLLVMHICAGGVML